MGYKVKVLSPAKLNLMLRILGQRDDGYHLLQTYFQLLDWGDGMEFISTTENTIDVVGEFKDLPKQDNLIYKAAQLLVPYKKKEHGIIIKVEKNIPQGSGLGGGSSNAGTTLRILNKIWKCNLPKEALQKLALKLGADVPIFAFNQSAMATGVGEKLQAIAIESYYYVLIFPQVSIATVDVFGEKKLKRNQKAINTVSIHDKNTWTNACLMPVLDKYQEVKNIFVSASKNADIYMSGTGSTLFAAFDNKAQAQYFVKQCPTQWKTIICYAK